jgi:hypothetical protein
MFRQLKNTNHIVSVLVDAEFSEVVGVGTSLRHTVALDRNDDFFDLCSLAPKYIIQALEGFDRWCSRSYSHGGRTRNGADRTARMSALRTSQSDTSLLGARKRNWQKLPVLSVLFFSGTAIATNDDHGGREDGSSNTLVYEEMSFYRGWKDGCGC